MREETTQGKRPRWKGMGTAVGIDLGTTYSAVAYIGSDGRESILKNDEGEAITPSVVYFGPYETLIGDAAKEMFGLGDPQAVAFFKRCMGDPTPLVDVREIGRAHV